MNAKKASPKEDQAQIERFKKAARALGCDENEAAFDEKLKAIASPKTKTPNSSALSGAHKTPSKQK